MTDERLTHLEARYAWLERHVVEQDKAMAELGDELLRLRRELGALRERLTQNEEPGGLAPQDEPPPPHY